MSLPASRRPRLEAALRRALGGGYSVVPIPKDDARQLRLGTVSAARERCLVRTGAPEGALHPQPTVFHQDPVADMKAAAAYHDADTEGIR